MSRFLSDVNVREVVDGLLPSIEDFLKRHAKRPHLAIVVLDPDPDLPQDVLSVLYYRNIRDSTGWEYPYDEIAMAKAELCFRQMCDSEFALRERPFCFREGDPPFAGGVYVNGLVVACSGVEEWFDQMFARWIAAGCHAIATHRMHKEVIELDLTSVPPDDQ